ncbi:MAG: glycerate kinase [Pseudomonadota bacterium]
MSISDLVTELFYTSLRAVDPYKSVRLHRDKINRIFQDGHFKRLLVVGFGKAACSMAESLQDYLEDLIETGIVITKYGHCPLMNKFKRITIYEAGHPLPDENGLRATNEMIERLKDSGEDTLITCLISGGGSALLVSPYEGITLDEKKHLTELLLKSGATIDELNTVRKHISRVKGGRLAEIACPAKVISFILSDVIGDHLDVIASGPTSPDKTTYQDAIQVLEKYQLIDFTSPKIFDVLMRGARGLMPETPKEGDPLFERVENIIIGTNRIALAAAKERAETLGLKVDLISSELSGEAREAGKWLAQKAMEIKSSRVQEFKSSTCLISGGETTVTVKGNGTGGRNMEPALSFATEIDGLTGITLLSAGTDGTDGPTDAAGAIVDGQTVAKAKNLGLDPKKYLGNNDSYNFFKKIGALFIAGPTGTNVMDVQIIIIEP